MNQSLHSAQSADDVVVVFFFTPGKKEKTQNRRPVHRSSTVFFCFFFLITSYRATSWLRAYPLLKWSSTILLPFFFFFMPPHGSEQTHCSIGPRPFSFPFFFTPPRGSEQTRCSIGPRPFIPLLRHLVAQSRHAAQSLLTIFFNNYPLLFTFDATSWLRTETNPGRDHTPRALPKGQVRKKVSMA